MDKQPRVGIGVFIRKGRKLLFGKRIGSHGEGTWGLPGGHLEFMETLEDCAKREVLEEAGIRIKNIQFGYLTNDFFKDEGKHYVTIFMVSDYDKGNVKVLEPNKMERFEWYEWGNSPSPLFLPIVNLRKQKFNPFFHK